MPRGTYARSETVKPPRLKLIALNLEEDLVQELKLLARDEGLRYQPFIRQILTHYVRQTRKHEAKLR
jgi:predicted DNA binding CopG/RHH family protein